MLIFKQKPIKGIIFLYVIMCVGLSILPTWMFIHTIITEGFSLENLLGWFLLFCLPILIAQLGLLSHIEWFEIYDDRIVAKNIFHTKNNVFFCNVQEVKEVTINVTNHDTERFYIFYDGRKDYKDIFGEMEPYNRRKYNLLIHKTPELEEFLTKRFDIEIIYRKYFNKYY